MKRTFLKTPVDRLRVVGYLEGVSLLVLIFVGVPMKYCQGNPSLVKSMGPIHGALFLWYIFSALSVGVEQKWKFKQTTWKVLIACVIPFGTFYIDRQILSKN